MAHDALAPPPATLRLVLAPEDSDQARRIEPLAQAAFATVEAFFGAPFPRRVTLRIYPDRAAFEAAFPPEWGLERTECWMVASGVAEDVRLLSPLAWRAEACEHDPDDDSQLRRLLAHEFVHAYHGQHNPSPDFVDVTGIDWFVEGLATLASGQLEDPALAPARESLELGAAPTSLARAWSGKYRYGVCGSLVAFVERERGREALRAGMGATNAEELLALVGLSEPELLAGWRASLAEE